MKMKKIFSSVISMVTAVSLLAGSVSASWDLDEQQAVEGDISSFVQVEEVTFGEPEPMEQPLAAEEELYQMEWLGELFDVEASGEEIQPMTDLPDLSVRNLQIKAGDMTSPYPAGMLMYYTFQLLNYGTADANGAEVIIKLDGEVATNPVSMGNVPAGKGGNIQFRGPEMSPGSHTMEIVVNPDRKIAESNYNNNTTSNTFTYKACFELVAVSMTSHKQTDENMVPTYEVGESVTFTMDFQNSGLLDVQNVPIALYGTFRAPGEQPVTSQMGYTNYIAKLPAKTRMKATVNLTFTKEASARISFVLDPEKILGDMDYNNNTAETILKVEGIKKVAVIVASKHGENDPDHPGDDFTGFASDTYAEYQKLENNNPPFDIYCKTQPTSTMLRGNLGSKKLMQSEVLTLFGHGNVDCLCFHPDFLGGQYKCGISYKNNDWDSSSTGYQYVGLKSEDMPFVDLISFIGCSTGGGDDNLVTRAVERGAKTALGFTNSIYPWRDDGVLWIQVYAEELAKGNTVVGAVQEASLEANKIAPFGGSSLARYRIIGGDQNLRLTEQNQTLSINREIKNRIDLNISYSESNTMMYTDHEDLKQGKDLLNNALVAEIEKLNPNFATEYYTVWYDEDIQVIFLSKVIPTDFGNVLTGLNYMISIKDGIAYQLDYSDQPTAEMVSKEETIPSRISNFIKNGGEKNIHLPEIPNAEVEVEKTYYGYQYEQDELFYVVEYVVTHLDEDGARSADEIVVQIP